MLPNSLKCSSDRAPAASVATTGHATSVSLASMNAKEGTELNLHWEYHVRVGLPYRQHHKGGEPGEHKDSGECNVSEVD